MKAAKTKRDRVFCEIVVRRAPAHVIEEDDRALCLLDVNRFVEGHRPVISGRQDEMIGLFRTAKPPR